MLGAQLRQRPRVLHQPRAQWINLGKRDLPQAPDRGFQMVTETYRWPRGAKCEIAGRGEQIQPKAEGGEKEEYQSWQRYNEFDDWKHKFLYKMLDNVIYSIKPDGQIMINKITETMLEAKHFWNEHKKVSIVFIIVLLIAIIV